MCDNHSSLHILCKFVCYFYAKCVINIQACTYCVNLCATFTQNVWFTLFWRELGHFKEFTLFCRKLAIVAIHAFFCVKVLLPKLRSRKFFDKYHVWLEERAKSCYTSGLGSYLSWATSLVFLLWKTCLRIGAVLVLASFFKIQLILQDQKWV